MADKSRILFIGGTGCIAKFLVHASAKLGHPTLALVRESSASEPAKAAVIDGFKAAGVTILPESVFNKEEDIGAFTIKAVNDPRTLNKTFYIRPAANTLSFNELVAVWEKKIGKTIEKVFLPEDVILKTIQESPIPLNVVLSITHAVFVRGDQTSFEIEPSFGVQASALYPDVKYTTVDEYLDQFV